DLRRCRRYAFLQPSNEIEVMVVTRPPLVIREAERQPDLRMAVHQVRAARRDADDLQPAPVDSDGAADHWSRPKSRLPKLIRNPGHGWRRNEAGLVCRKKTPLGRLDFQCIQQMRVDSG